MSLISMPAHPPSTVTTYAHPLHHKAPAPTFRWLTMKSSSWCPTLCYGHRSEDTLGRIAPVKCPAGSVPPTARYRDSYFESTEAMTPAEYLTINPAR
jgi:hypothetical protein